MRENQKRKTKSEKRQKVAPFLRFSFFVFRFAFCLLLIGCANQKRTPTTRPVTAYERQQAALRDPFDYSPDMEKRDVTGGGWGQFDREGMRKDLDNVLNP